MDMDNDSDPYYSDGEDDSHALRHEVRADSESYYNTFLRPVCLALKKPMKGSREVARGLKNHLVAGIEF
jgi:hypothetical protein